MTSLYLLPSVAVVKRQDHNSLRLEGYSELCFQEDKVSHSMEGHGMVAGGGSWLITFLIHTYEAEG